MTFRIENAPINAGIEKAAIPCLCGKQPVLQMSNDFEMTIRLGCQECSKWSALDRSIADNRMKQVADLLRKWEARNNPPEIVEEQIPNMPAEDSAR